MTKKKPIEGDNAFADYANVPGGAARLVELGKKYGLACKYPGCLCASKCLRRDEPFCVGCGAPEDWCQCEDGFDAE